MKDLITTIASILLLMTFLLQFFSGQVVHQKLLRADMAIDNFRDSAKEEGFISYSNSLRLQQQLAAICDCELNEVVVEGCGELREKGELIDYSVSFPVKDIIAAAGMFGIPEEENSKVINEEGVVVSRMEAEEDEEYDNNDGADNTV